MLDSRPSHKECTSKIRQALEIIHGGGGIRILNYRDLLSEADDLGYTAKEELSDVLKELLENLRPENFIGRRPPEKSYKAEIVGCELFAFRLFLNRFDCDVFFKFAIKKSEFWLVSLHRDRPLSMDDHSVDSFAQAED